MMTRRTVLAATATAFLPCWATRAAAAPVLDRLEMTVLCDGTAGQFGALQRLPGLAVEPTPRFADHRAALRAEWSYSLVARANGRTVLIDFGYAPGTLVNNMALLGIDHGSIDAMMLSHGHYDHFGGLEALVAARRLRRGVSLHVGGEEAFCERVRGATADAPSFGAIDRAAAERAGVRFVVSADPQPLAGIGTTTGHIPLVSPERPRTPTSMRPGRGCERALLDPAKRGAALVADDAAHELGAAFLVRGHGLVVIGSCSHRGIVNTVRRAQAVTGETRLLAVMGGFHLVPPQTPVQALQTVDLLRALNPRYIVPGHCSGEIFIAAATAAMPGRVLRAPVGTRLTFG